MSTSTTVGLHVLGTDVDVEVGGADPDGLARMLRDRWHLCLREAGRGSGRRGPSGEDAPSGDAEGASRHDAPALLLRAARLTGEEPADRRSAWRREATTVEDEDVRRLLQRLTQSITHAVITDRTGELLMLHAAGVCHPVTGATAVFVAPGNTGKTTLCRTLGPGRGYITDETVGIRRDGSIDVYAKPLSVRRPDWTGVKDETAPGAVGLTVPERRPWVAGIVLLRREGEHAGPPLVEELDLMDAVVALVPESSGFMRTDRPLAWLASVLERTGGARRVTYAEVADLEPLVEEICARRSPW